MYCSNFSLVLSCILIQVVTVGARTTGFVDVLKLGQGFQSTVQVRDVLFPGEFTISMWMSIRSSSNVSLDLFSFPLMKVRLRGTKLNITEYQQGGDPVNHDLVLLPVNYRSYFNLLLRKQRTNLVIYLNGAVLAAIQGTDGRDTLKQGTFFVGNSVQFAWSANANMAGLWVWSVPLSEGTVASFVGRGLCAEESWGTEFVLTRWFWQDSTTTGRADGAKVLRDTEYPVTMGNNIWSANPVDEISNNWKPQCRTDAWWDRVDGKEMAVFNQPFVNSRKAESECQRFGGAKLASIANAEQLKWLLQATDYQDVASFGEEPEVALWVAEENFCTRFIAPTKEKADDIRDEGTDVNSIWHEFWAEGDCGKLFGYVCERSAQKVSFTPMLSFPGFRKQGISVENTKWPSRSGNTWTLSMWIRPKRIESLEFLYLVSYRIGSNLKFALMIRTERLALQINGQGQDKPIGLSPDIQRFIDVWVLLTVVKHPNYFEVFFGGSRAGGDDLWKENIDTTAEDGCLIIGAHTDQTCSRVVTQPLSHQAPGFDFLGLWVWNEAKEHLFIRDLAERRCLQDSLDAGIFVTGTPHRDKKQVQMVQGQNDWSDSEHIDECESPRRCLTVRGPKPGAPCSFPIYWEGSVLDGCSSEGNGGKLWCPVVDGDASRLLESGQWGECRNSPACKVKGTQTVTPTVTAVLRFGKEATGTLYYSSLDYAELLKVFETDPQFKNSLAEAIAMDMKQVSEAPDTIVINVLDFADGTPPGAPRPSTAVAFSLFGDTGRDVLDVTTLLRETIAAGQGNFVRARLNSVLLDSPVQVDITRIRVRVDSVIDDSRVVLEAPPATPGAPTLSDVGNAPTIEGPAFPPRPLPPPPERDAKGTIIIVALAAGIPLLIVFCVLCCVSCALYYRHSKRVAHRILQDPMTVTNPFLPPDADIVNVTIDPNAGKPSVAYTITSRTLVDGTITAKNTIVPAAGEESDHPDAAPVEDMASLPTGMATINPTVTINQTMTAYATRAMIRRQITGVSNHMWQVSEIPMGVGSVGTVLQGIAEEGCWVAIRIFPKPNQSVIDLYKRIYKLRHANLIPLHDIAHIDSLLYLVMEYVNGGSIFKLVEDWSVRRACLEETYPIVQAIIRDIMAGLHYLHSEGIVHGDIRPENVLLVDSTQRTAKLSDVGLGKAIELCGKEIVWRATALPYLAPEVIKSGVESFAGDVWSVGIVTCFLISGHLPWKHLLKQPSADDRVNISATQLAEAICTPGCRPQIPKGIPKLAADFIKNCLHVHAKNRTSAEDLQHHPFLKTDVDISKSVSAAADQQYKPPI